MNNLFGTDFINQIPKEREGWVYLLWAVGTNRYKIGRSVNPVVRQQTINNQSPYPIKILDCFWTIDAVTDERMYHQQNSSYRVHGEWFEVERLWEFEEVSPDNANFEYFWHDFDSPYKPLLVGGGIPSPTINFLFGQSLEFLRTLTLATEGDAHLLDRLILIYASAKTRQDLLHISFLIYNVIAKEIMPLHTSEMGNFAIIGMLTAGCVQLLDQQKLLEDYRTNPILTHWKEIYDPKKT